MYMSHKQIFFLYGSYFEQNNNRVSWNLAWNIRSSGRSRFGEVFVFKGYPLKNILDLTTAGDWDCLAAVEHLPALHDSVDFIFLSFGILGFIVEL